MTIWGNNFFSQYIFPGMYARRVEKNKLIPIFEKIESTTQFEIPSQHIKEAVDILKAEVKEQLDRKNGLEGKIKSILFVISVSITAITFCLKDLEWSYFNWLNLVGLAVLGLSIFYFLSSALLSIKALIPVPFYETHAKIEFDTETNIISYQAVKSADELQVLTKDKLLNDNINLRIQNTTSAVLQLLQNGMILFAVFFGTALYQKINKPALKKPPVVKGSLHINSDTVKEINILISSHSDTTLRIQTTNAPHSQVKTPLPFKKGINNSSHKIK